MAVRRSLLLCVVAGCSSAPESPCSAELLRRLGHDDPDVRVEAQAILESLNPAMACQLELEAARQTDSEVAARLRNSAAALRRSEKRASAVHRLRSSSKLTAALIRDLSDLGEEFVPALAEACAGPAASPLAGELLDLIIGEEHPEYPQADYVGEIRVTLFDAAVNVFFRRSPDREPTADEIAEDIRAYFTWGGDSTVREDHDRRILDLAPLMAWMTLQVVPLEVSSAAPPERRIHACCEWLRNHSGRLQWDGKRLTSVPPR